MRSALACLILAALIAGCAAEPSSDDETGWNTSQQRALDDPMNYGPKFNRSNVSGGELHEFDREGFKRDMDSLLLN
jgi:hypothetical protein